MSNVLLNAGTGGATLGTDQVAGSPAVDYQIVKIGFSAAGAAPVQVQTGNPLPVVQTGALPVGANVIGAVTQSGGPWTFNLTQLAGNALATGNGVSGTGVLRVVLAADQTSLTNAIPVAQSGVWTVTVSGTVTANLGTIAGVATAAKQPALGTAGAASTDVITVQGIASMTPLKTDGSAVTQPVSGTVTANQGTAAVGSAAWPVNLVEDTTNTIVHPGDATNKAVRVNIVAGAGSGGTAIADGATFTRGTTSETPAGGIAETAAPTLITGKAAALSLDLSGNLRTTVANGISSGTAGSPSVNVISVQGVASMTPIQVDDEPVTTGGWTSWSTPNNNTNAPLIAKALVKGSAGKLGGYIVFNPNASTAYIQVFDAASTAAVTLGTNRPSVVIPLPAGSAANLSELKWGFASGMVVAATTTDSGNTAVGTGLTCTFFYK